jgi:hypothetical protein
VCEFQRRKRKRVGKKEYLSLYIPLLLFLLLFAMRTNKLIRTAKTPANVWECNDILFCVWDNAQFLDYAVCRLVSRKWRRSVQEYLEGLRVVKFDGKFGVDSSNGASSAATSTRKNSKRITTVTDRIFGSAIRLLSQCTNLTYLCLEPPPGDFNTQWCCSHSGYLDIIRMLPSTLEVLCLRNWIVHCGMPSRSGQYITFARELRRARLSEHAAAAAAASLRAAFAARVAALAHFRSLRALLLTVPLDAGAHPFRGLRYLNPTDDDDVERARTPPEHSAGEIDAPHPSHPPPLPVESHSAPPAWARAWRDAVRAMPHLDTLHLDGLALPAWAGLAGLGHVPPPPAAAAAAPWRRLRVLHLRAPTACGGGGGGASDEALLALAAACPGLEELRVDGAGPGVTDRGLEGVCRGCRGLTVVSIADAPGVRGGAAAAAALAGRAVRWLGFSGTAVGEEFLIALARQVRGLLMYYILPTHLCIGTLYRGAAEDMQYIFDL